MTHATSTTVHNPDGSQTMNITHHGTLKGELVESPIRGEIEAFAHGGPIAQGERVGIYRKVVK